ncbi:DoxX family protein [Trujillonella humicola]|uniref:DoxX family protein n=1 Tax=Trujillonella humicola TaxID=3383699 RepID=UPI0039062D0E
MARKTRTTRSETGGAGLGVSRFLLRTVVGGTMIAHGVRHGRTLEGTARWFGSIGFKQPKLQAQTSAVVEIGSGAALVLGAATPLAASAVVGTLAVAARSVHLPNGFFVVNEGYEFVLNLSVASVVLAALGPGRWSVDHALGTDRFSGSRAALLAAGLGIGGAAAQLATFWRKPAPKPVPA